ncbi:MAG: hypothetical protein EWV62_18845 [Microcystis aeruginosa Ma_OC_LR_19540900_S633]|nr:MAG: hypothetical protein EWV62_18845 [Microcystis aeruginosa Ma_OC_LR_19540900_S633]
MEILVLRFVLCNGLLAIFVNCFLSRANSSIKSLAREGFSQFMPPYRTITSNEEPKSLPFLAFEMLSPRCTN